MTLPVDGQTTDKIDEIELDPEPIHGWFGLSYSNYQVLSRTLMQSMPVEWQRRIVACFEELREAFEHVPQPDYYIVEPAREVEYSGLSASEARLIDVTWSGNEVGHEGPEVWWDRDGNEHMGWERALVPTGDDPIPHYHRGRTFIKPKPRGAP